MLIICEPQCIGFEHVELNSALITLHRNAFPKERILFFAEKSHLEHVRAKVDGDGGSTVEFYAIGVPVSRRYESLRLPRDLATCCKIFHIARKNGCDKVLFCSITGSTLFSIKTLMKFYSELKCVVIPHVILETILDKPPGNPIEMPFWFRRVLGEGNNDNIFYLVLGESIRERLCREIPKLAGHVGAMDHPYHFVNTERSIRKLSIDDSTISFGFFGIGLRKKGIDLFVRMAGELREMKAMMRPNFVVIGKILDKETRSRPLDHLEVPSPVQPLSRDQYDYYANKVDYSLFLYRANTHRLNPCGTMYDAFSYLKPMIAIGNPYLEYYFRTYGDIGYLCEDYEDVKATILKILNEKPDARYLEQQKNLLNARDRLKIYGIPDEIRSFWNKK
ncbi:MAG TPA: hypothetical protein VMC84_06145 [Methanocella sp.]|uniref:hypothetical protein n=1 Tax=Methanocella sp. TaxID=2052833 RepID=UPI002C5C95B9|nr:hypothetical protein [Methanocella sp.]HTY90743.1 hypothetical protein [Methanocella sp.]